jgi:transcriptional regulator with XRE-family HTH domain
MSTEKKQACPTCGQSATSLGERISACRAVLNWTRAEVAERVGVTPARLALWEEDKARPLMFEVEALAALFERPPAYFSVTHNEPN